MPEEITMRAATKVDNSWWPKFIRTIIGMQPWATPAGVGPVGWSPWLSSQTQQPSGEEPQEVWDADGFKSKQEYLKARPWRKKGVTQARYEQARMAEISRGGSEWYSQATTGKTTAELKEEGKKKEDPYEMDKAKLDLQRWIAEREDLRETEKFKLADTQREAEMWAAQANIMEKQRVDRKLEQSAQWAREGLTQTPWGTVIGPGERALAPEGWTGPVKEMYGSPRQAPLNADLQGAMNRMRADQVEQARAFELQKLSWGFEKVREAILSSTAPRDWFKKERERLAINPYEEALSELRTQGQTLRQQNRIDERDIDMYLNATPRDKTPRYREGTVNVPKDVQAFMPKGQGEFGTGMETPSGQGWARAPWATKEALVGYAEALGQPEADFLGAMAAMRPRAPSRGTEWTPARRR